MAKINSKLPGQIGGIIRWTDFWGRVKKSDGCWEWDQVAGTGRYGKVKLAGVKMSAHRVAYLLAFDEIPEGYDVLHLCDNKSCVRPTHLAVGNPKRNGARPRNDFVKYR